MGSYRADVLAHITTGAIARRFRIPVAAIPAPASA